jgi:hypothetical protein
MTNNLPKLERFDVYSKVDGFVAKDYCEDGSYLRVEDLIYWIQTHVREGTISTVYSDLLKALGEGDKQ